MEYNPLSDKEEQIAEIIVNAAYTVHRALGPGLMEGVYEVCFCHEINENGFSCTRQVPVPIIYKGIKFDVALRLDVLVEDLVLCELKAVETMSPLFEAQLLTYLKLTQKRLGFLINFNVPLIRDGIRRIIL